MAKTTHDTEPTNSSVNNCISETKQPSPKLKKQRTSREIRQVRMFKAILLIMTVFFVCRLPTWIYLLYKLYNTANTNLHWLLHYWLGLLSIVNCILNPFLYTFLTETIQLSFTLQDNVKALFTFRRKQTIERNEVDGQDEPPPPNDNSEFENKGKFYFSEDKKVKMARPD